MMKMSNEDTNNTMTLEDSISSSPRVCECGETYTDDTNDENTPHGHLDSRWHVSENGIAIHSAGITAHYANGSVYIFLQDDDDILNYRRGNYSVHNVSSDGCVLQIAAEIVEALEDGNIQMQVNR